jgi:hypothetical protein
MSSVLGNEFNTLTILNPMPVEQFDICIEFYIKWYISFYFNSYSNIVDEGQT